MSFDVGIIDGPRGRATLLSMDDDELRLDFEPTALPPPLFPIALFVGLSRPQTVRRVLRDCTSLGVAHFVFFSSDRGEAGYAASSLWSSGEYRRHLVDGAQQAFSTRLPTVEVAGPLASLLPAGGEGSRIALDNYESPRSLRAHLQEMPSIVDDGIELLIGSERGWSAEERTMLRSSGIPLVHLGERVLRTEVACITAVGIVLSELGCFDPDDPTDA